MFIYFMTKCQYIRYGTNLVKIFNKDPPSGGFYFVLYLSLWKDGKNLRNLWD